MAVIEMPPRPEPTWLYRFFCRHDGLLYERPAHNIADVEPVDQTHAHAWKNRFDVFELPHHVEFREAQA